MPDRLSDRHALGVERMERCGLIDHGLQRHRVRDQFVVDDGFLLIGRIVGAKQALPAECQVFGKAMVSLDHGSYTAPRAQ